MKKFIGKIVSELLFWIGDKIGKPMYYFDWAWIYPVYNKIMLASADVQDWSGCAGPWAPVKQKKRKRNLKKVLNETESQ